MFDPDCEMAYGEQAALRGLLARLRPTISLEIGTYRGGSLRTIAEYSEEVHTFDLASHTEEHLPDVTYHLGDSRETVPALLRTLEAEGRNVDFVLIDGDHARAGVAADLASILDSGAVRRTVVLMHDAANEDVRAGIRDAGLDRPKLAYANLSFCSPWEPTRRWSEKWGGFALLVVDERGDLWPHPPGVEVNAGWPTSVQQPASWRAATPLRAARRKVVYRLRPLVRRLRGTRGAALG